MFELHMTLGAVLCALELPLPRFKANTSPSLASYLPHTRAVSVACRTVSESLRTFAQHSTTSCPVLEPEYHELEVPCVANE
jgi:hypothetical protein